MNQALIIAHGQPSDPEPAERALRAFAGKVQSHAPDLTVHSATMAACTPAAGAVEAALARLDDSDVVYPLFMAKGWFVTSALPKRLGTWGGRILDPLGVDPDLAGLAAKTLRMTIRQQGWAEQQTDIVLAAHGSGRSRNPSQVARAFADNVRALIDVASIRVGFVEEAPGIEEAATGTGTRSICLPFFACQGGHATQDVPQALDAAGFTGQRLPVLGEVDLVTKQIAHRLTEAFNIYRI